MSAENKSSNTKKVKCPQCGLLTIFSPENPYRPFCSERCKVIDLGGWASDKYSIPVSPTSSDSLTDIDDFDDEEDL